MIRTIGKQGGKTKKMIPNSEARFKAKIRKLGPDSLGITIPKVLIESKYLDEDKEYWFYAYTTETEEQNIEEIK